MKVQEEGVFGKGSLRRQAQPKARRRDRVKGPRRLGEQPAQSAPRGHEGTVSLGQLSRDSFTGLGRTGRASPCSLSRSPGDAANLIATLAGRSWPPGCGLTRSGCLWLVCTGVQVTTEPAPLLPASSLRNHPAPARPVCAHTRTLSTSRASWAAAGGLAEPASSWAQRVPSEQCSQSVSGTPREDRAGGNGTHSPPTAGMAGSPAVPSDRSYRRGATF